MMTTVYLLIYIPKEDTLHVNVISYYGHLLFTILTKNNGDKESNIL